MRGRALAAQWQVDEGIAQMQQGLAFFQATGTELVRLNFLPGLAAAYARAGRVAEGLAVLAEALAFVGKTGARVGEAGLYRLKGELTLQSSLQSLASSVKKSGKSTVNSGKLQVPNTQPPTPPTQEAEACFFKALEVSRLQQAKSLELRATTSLARLWQRQGKQYEARKMLADIYHWFTEGFETKDLQEAKALLEELGQ